MQPYLAFVLQSYIQVGHSSHWSDGWHWQQWCHWLPLLQLSFYPPKCCPRARKGRFPLLTFWKFYWDPSGHSAKWSRIWNSSCILTDIWWKILTCLHSISPFPQADTCLGYLELSAESLHGCIGVHISASCPHGHHVLFNRDRWTQAVPKRRVEKYEFVLPDLKDFSLENLGAAFLRVKCKRDWKCLKKLIVSWTEEFWSLLWYQLIKLIDWYLFVSFFVF